MRIPTRLGQNRRRHSHRVDQCTLDFIAGGRCISVPPHKILELQAETTAFISARTPVVASRLLHSNAGRVSFIAGHPDTTPIPQRGFAPRSLALSSPLLAHTKCVVHSLTWFMACFTLHGTCIGKTYLLKYPPSAQLRTAVDASPGGLGGVLHQGCTPARWFADPITQLTKISSQQNESPQFNPLWEALAICVSLCVDRMMRRARISHDPS